MSINNTFRGLIALALAAAVAGPLLASEETFQGPPAWSHARVQGRHVLSGGGQAEEAWISHRAPNNVIFLLMTTAERIDAKPSVVDLQDFVKQTALQGKHFKIVTSVSIPLCHGRVGTLAEFTTPTMDYLDVMSQNPPDGKVTFVVDARYMYPHGTSPDPDAIAALHTLCLPSNSDLIKRYER